MQSRVGDSKITRNNIRKKCLLLEINTFTKFLLFKMNMLLTGIVYLIIDTYYFIISNVINELINK